jgi:hypothetical protein
MSSPATDEVNTPSANDDDPATDTAPTAADDHGAGNSPPPGLGSVTDTDTDLDADNPSGSVTVNDTVNSPASGNVNDGLATVEDCPSLVDHA